jgi:hypothetical protein
MEYTFEIQKAPEEIVRSYVAEITGTHPVYVFNRRFLEPERVTPPESDELVYNRFDIGFHGVFEVSTKWFVIEEKNGCRNLKQIRREVYWFVAYRKRIYPVDRYDVLFTLFNLRRQYVQRRKSHAA